MVAAANPSANSTRDLRHFNFGSSDPVLKVHEPPTSQVDSFDVIFALNEDVQVTPSGSVPASDEFLEEENNATEDPADEFYYQGLAQGSFSGTKSVNLLAWLFNLISQLVDYILGFMTMIIKVVIIGWANIFVNIITEALDALTGEAVEAPVEDTENTSGNTTGNTTSNTTQANVVTSDTAENQTQSILDNDNLYTPSSTELQPEGDNKKCNNSSNVSHFNIYRYKNGNIFNCFRKSRIQENVSKLGCRFCYNICYSFLLNICT